MNTPDFNVCVEEQLQRVYATLVQKAGEYAHGDRLSNFKRPADMMRMTPEKVLIGYWMKHITSILDFVDELDKGVLRSEDIWAEKITDAQAYLCLLKAFIRERHVNMQKDNPPPEIKNG
ncbi:MAG TPA: hypothetical protein PKB02_02425 [Anaerohalosphaeraceae bacterium]|nr:hypothetical protein [Anaerohalosphaeraceae bacterium]